MAVDEPERDLSAELGARLRELRETRGLHQQDVADFVGLTSKSHVSKMEAGKRSISVKHLHLWARSLRARIEILLWPDEDDHAGLFAAVADASPADQELISEFAATLGQMDPNIKRGLRRMFAELRDDQQL